MRSMGERAAATALTDVHMVRQVERSVRMPPSRQYPSTTFGGLRPRRTAEISGGYSAIAVCCLCSVRSGLARWSSSTSLRGLPTTRREPRP